MSHMAIPNDVSPQQGSTAVSRDITMYPSGGNVFLRWDPTQEKNLPEGNFIAANAGWGLVNGWPRRQTIAEKTLQKLQQQIGPDRGYLPGFDDLRFETDDYGYPVGMLPLRVLVGKITPDYSYSFRKDAGVWAVQQDATNAEPGIKLLARLIDGREVELPCSDWPKLTEMVCFDDDLHDHILEPKNVNELLMQVQYCFLIAAANKVHGFEGGKELPIHRNLAIVLQNLTHRMAAQEEPEAGDSFVNGHLTALLAENLTLKDKIDDDNPMVARSG